MKTTRTRAAFVRPSMTRPLSHPALRFLEGDGTGPGGGQGAAPADEGPTGETVDEKTHEDPPDGGKANDISSLPEWAQEHIRSLRQENKASRLSAKETAAQEARDALAQDIGKALGLIKDEGQAPDPAELTKQVEAAQASQRQASIELAVYKTASQHDGDPAALLDSRAFLEKVAALDPTADDFASQVGNAIKAQVESNPKLKAESPVPGRSGGEIRGGDTTPPAQTPAQLAASIRKNRPY